MDLLLPACACAPDVGPDATSRWSWGKALAEACHRVETAALVRRLTGAGVPVERA